MYPSGAAIARRVGDSSRLDGPDRGRAGTRVARQMPQRDVSGSSTAAVASVKARAAASAERRARAARGLANAAASPGAAVRRRRRRSCRDTFARRSTKRPTARRGHARATPAAPSRVRRASHRRRSLAGRDETLAPFGTHGRARLGRERTSSHHHESSPRRRVESPLQLRTPSAPPSWDPPRRLSGTPRSCARRPRTGGAAPPSSARSPPASAPPSRARASRTCGSSSPSR